MTTTIESVDVDCRGMQCPAPILQIAKAAREVAAKPAVLHVFADDGDFPSDLEAWCRSARAELSWVEEEEGLFHAMVALNGAPIDAVEAEPEPAPAPVPQAGQDLKATPSGIEPLDLTGLAPHVAVMRMSAMLMACSTVRVHTDDASFQSALYGWASATRALVSDVVQGPDGFSATVAVAPEVAEQVSLPTPTIAPPQLIEAEEPTTALVRVDPNQVPRENRATLLVLHNDLEALLASMLTANACAAQGMDVTVFFSFWGVNMLRGYNPNAVPEPKGILQRLMQWMMPSGPGRQVLGKMNMAGMGTGMMKHFMSSNNVLPLEELMQQAIEQGVTFQVCTMSMGVMGIQKADLMDLPNLEFAGVTSFTEQARRSAMSMVF